MIFLLSYLVNENNTLNIIAHSCTKPNAPCSCPLLERTSSVKYLGVIIDETHGFHQHIESLTGRVRKLVYIFKNLRYVSDFAIIKLVYLALCQSIVNYCVTIWGGAPSTTLLPLERAQRLILKVGLFLPRLYPTSKLYSLYGVLTVRQLFILQIILHKHSQLKFDSNYNNKRRKHDVCSNVNYRTKFSGKFFCFLGSYLYNKLNNILKFYPLTKYESKKIITDWLLSLDYKATEDLLKIVT